MATRRITTRNAWFQQLQALLHNRTKRNRAGELLVQGVRPISMAVEHGWTVRTLLYDAEARLSGWAQELLSTTPAEPVATAPHLLAELSEKSEGTVELLAVVEMPADDLARVRVGPSFLGVVFDRPTQPGNIGAIARSADAFGADTLITTGHAADAYDPQSVRASTGSLFAVPVVRSPSHREVMRWVADLRAAGSPLVVVATDEHGDVDATDLDLTRPSLLLTGNETAGLSRAWLEAADVTIRIPMAGSASSLNASNAASIVLYEAHRQRVAAQHAPTRTP